jgi:uncharacterized membrane protein YeaQ/YmgE (transglycosylase-associated protein family)
LHARALEAFAIAKLWKSGNGPVGSIITATLGAFLLLLIFAKKGKK